MERFITFLAAKFSLTYKLHSGLVYYALNRNSLNDDVLRLIGYVSVQTTADVLRRVDSLHGPVPNRMKLEAIRELKRRGHVMYSVGPLKSNTQLSLTTTGRLEHTSIHIVEKLRAAKKQVAV